jgi:Ni/Co efflux regulator RcnB
MPHTKLAVFVVFCLAIVAPMAFAGDRSADSVDRQQAVEHQREVQRMKDRDQDSAWERRHQAESDREKVKKPKELKEDAKEHAEEEEGFGNDLDEDGVDSSE